MKKKILKKVVIVLGVLVIVYHACWFYNYSLFSRFKDGLDVNQKFMSYSSLVDGYIYHVKYPFYTSFIGNLAVATDDSDYTLIIWPSRFTDTEYGVMVPTGNDSFTSIMINEKVEAENEYDQVLIDKNKEQIEDLFQKATERWGDGYK